MRRQLAVILILTALSQLAAFFKLWFTARVFGIGSELDGYNLALVAPAMVSGVMAGVLQTGLFPVRANLYAKKGMRATEAFERAVLLGSACLGIIFTILVVVGSEWLARAMTPVSQAAVRTAFLVAMPYTATLIAFNLIADCSSYLLAMRDKFQYAAGAPILNGVLGGLLLAWWPEGGLQSLLVGTVCGTMLQLTICFYGLRQSGFSLLGNSPAMSGLSEFRELLLLGSWVLPGVLFSNLIVSLPPIWAAQYGEGAVSAFGYAYRLHSSLVQLLVMASSTLILARFSELIAVQQIAAVRRLLRLATLWSILIGVAGVIIVWGAGENLLIWLFQGRFDAHAASRVADLWIWLTMGLGFSLLGNVFAKLWQAQSRPRLISAMAASSLLSMCMGYFVLRGLIGEEAIALAMSLAAMAVVLLGCRYLNLRPHLKKAQG